MLKINSRQCKHAENNNILSLTNRLDKWLSLELSDWNNYKKKNRENLLEQLISHAKRGNFKVETDYALFVWICIEQLMEVEEFIQRKDIKILLKNQKISPAGKLVRMEQLAKNPPTDQSRLP